jgi:hypothetical protein
MLKTPVALTAAIALLSFCRSLMGEEVKEALPEHYRATIAIDYNRPKLTSLGVRDFPSLVDDVNTFLLRREFTLADLEAMHVWGSSASLKDVARVKVTLTREPDPPKEVKQPDKPATPLPMIVANNPPPVEEKTIAQPVAVAAPAVPAEARPAPAPQPPADPPADLAADSTTFHGRLPAHYTQVGVTDLQRQKIYSVQASYDAKITLLKNQLNEATAKRDAEVRAVLTADQQKQLDKLTGAAAKAQAAQKAPAGK